MVVRELFAKLGLEVDPEGFKKAEGLIGSLRFGLAAVGAAATAAAGYGVHKFVEALGETAQHALDVSKAAQQVGVTTDAFQEMTFAAKSAGVDVEALQTGLRLLSRTAYAASQGSQEAAYNYRALGISVRGADGQIKPADELLEEVSGKFAAMPDGVKKTALAMQIFGRSGAQLIPFLNKGPAGIKDLREEAHRFGVVLDEGVIGRSKEYLKVKREFAEALEGLKYSLVAPFIGPNGALQALTEWIVENRKTIGQILPAIFAKAKTAAGWVASALKAIYNAVRLIVAYKPLLIGTLAAIALAFSSTLVPAIGSAISAVMTFNLYNIAAAARAAVAWAAAFLPWVAGALAIATVVLLLDDVAGFLRGDDALLSRFSGSIREFYDTLKSKPGEWWVTAAIKDALYALSHLVDVYDRYFGKSDVFYKNRGPDQGNYTGKMPDASAFATPPAYVPPGAARAPVSNSFTPTINITGVTGDASQLGPVLTNQFDEWWNTKMRESFSGVGGG